MRERPGRADGPGPRCACRPAQRGPSQPAQGEGAAQGGGAAEERTSGEAPVGHAGPILQSEPWRPDTSGQLDVAATIDAFVATAGALERDDFRLLTRGRHVRNYVILVDHSGSMVGPKLELGATMAAALAQLSAAGRADYAVIAFDEELKHVKALGEPSDVEEVVDRILRLPEGRATDLGAALRAAAEAAEALPDATDVILISDCMPTRGLKTFARHL